MLAVKKDLVDMSKASNETCKYSNKFVAGDMWPKHETISGVYWSTWAVQETLTGIVGDATVATEDTGKKMIDLVINNLKDLIDLYYNFSHEKETTKKNKI